MAYAASAAFLRHGLELLLQFENIGESHQNLNLPVRHRKRVLVLTVCVYGVMVYVRFSNFKKRNFTVNERDRDISNSRHSKSFEMQS